MQYGLIKNENNQVAVSNRIFETLLYNLFLSEEEIKVNRTGNYYIEAQTRDQTRTDIIIDYLGKQYVIEMKIWRGKQYNEDGEKQIRAYLDYFDLDTGYMLSFNFNKNKSTGVRMVEIDGKTLYEGVA